MTDRLLLVAALALALAGCGSNKPPPPEAVAAPLDALRLGLQSYDDAQFVAATQLFGKALVQYRSVDDSRGQARRHSLLSHSRASARPARAPAAAAPSC